jgi:hypothetical protein
VSSQAGSTNYTIEALESGRDTVPRALKVPRTAACGASSDYFYVEAREALGYDAFLAGNSNVLNGVLVHNATPGSPNSSNLLDMTAATTSWSDPALVGGITFTDPGSGLTITPVSAGGTMTTVNVTYPPASCTRAAPTVTLTPSGTEYTSAGGSASYTATVTNNDSCGCASSAFGITAIVPAGWSATSGQTSSLAPGASGTAPLTIDTSSSAPAAFYTVPSTTANMSAPSFATTTNATVAVVGATSVAVASSQATYMRPAKANQTVYAVISTTVTSGGVAIAGASVSVQIRNPKGSTTTLSATTGGNGVASVSYAIKSKSVVGTYAVTSTVSLNGANTSGTTTFTVM